MATPKAIVKRHGELKEIPSEHVVPGISLCSMPDDISHAIYALLKPQI